MYFDCLPDSTRVTQLVRVTVRSFARNHLPGYGRTPILAFLSIPFVVEISRDVSAWTFVSDIRALPPGEGHEREKTLGETNTAAVPFGITTATTAVPRRHRGYYAEYATAVHLTICAREEGAPGAIRVLARQTRSLDGFIFDFSHKLRVLIKS